MGDLIGTLDHLLDGIGTSPLGQIALSVIAGFVLLELMGLIESTGVLLLRLVAKCLPPVFRERYTEENEAVIRSAVGPISKAVCAISAITAAIRIMIFEKRMLFHLEASAKLENFRSKGVLYEHEYFEISREDSDAIIRILTANSPDLIVYRNRLAHAWRKDEVQKILKDYMKEQGNNVSRDRYRDADQ